MYLRGVPVFDGDEREAVLRENTASRQVCLLRCVITYYRNNLFPRVSDLLSPVRPRSADALAYKALPPLLVMLLQPGGALLLG